MSRFDATKFILRAVDPKDLVTSSRDVGHAPHRVLSMYGWPGSPSVMSDASEAFVYMLTNDRGNVLYIGATEDLKERLYFHKRGMIAGFTKKYNVHRLVYFERYGGIDAAKKRERELKGKTRAKKELLIRSMNPTFSDLSSDIA